MKRLKARAGGSSVGGRVLLAAGIFLAFTAASMADPIADVGRDLITRCGDAVTTVKLAIKQDMSFGGRQGVARETKSEVTGTVLDGSGLTVVSLSATDPAGMMSKIMMNMGAGAEDRMQFESSLTDIKMLLPGGKEVPAEVVLRDRELDLAFVRPLEKLAKPLTAVVDAGKSVRPRILDQVLVMERMGTVANREAALSVTRVAAVVEKPRTFFILDNVAGMGGMGGPVFSADGKPMGILLLRSVKTEGGGGLSAMLSGPQNLGILPVVVPLDDVLESASQVPAAGEKATIRPAEKATPTPESGKPAPDRTPAPATP